MRNNNNISAAVKCSEADVLSSKVFLQLIRLPAEFSGHFRRPSLEIGQVFTLFLNFGH
jgi:hypothetical protein